LNDHPDFVNFAALETDVTVSRVADCFMGAGIDAVREFL
jgi:hypothetical protein